MALVTSGALEQLKVLTGDCIVAVHEAGRR